MQLIELTEERLQMFAFKFVHHGPRDKSRQAAGTDAAAHGSGKGHRYAHGELSGGLRHPNSYHGRNMRATRSSAPETPLCGPFAALLVLRKSQHLVPLRRHRLLVELRDCWLLTRAFTRSFSQDVAVIEVGPTTCASEVAPATREAVLMMP